MKAHITYEFTDEDRMAIGMGRIAPHGGLQEFMREAITAALPAIRRDYYKHQAEKYKELAEE